MMFKKSVSTRLVVALFVVAVAVGYLSADALAVGACQSCNKTTPGTPCPANPPKACFLGTCGAPALTTGLCEWVGTWCSAAVCPTGKCSPTGNNCQAKAPGGQSC